MTEKEKNNAIQNIAAHYETVTNLLTEIYKIAVNANATDFGPTIALEEIKMKIKNWTNSI